MYIYESTYICYEIYLVRMIFVILFNQSASQENQV